MLDEVLNISLRTDSRQPSFALTTAEPVRDEQLVRAVLGGDEAAFAELFERHKRMVVSVVGRFFRSASEIEELTQQSFTKAFFSLKNYRGGEERSFPAWITRIAVNVCYDEFRRRSRKGERLFSEMSDEEVEYLDTVVDKRECTPDRALIASQLAEKLLGALDERDRLAMTLVYSEDYTLDEVASAIGITTSNLKSRLFRCRNLIKGKFSHIFR